MYNPALVEPMRRELTEVGFRELKTAAEVDELLTKEKGTVLLVVNSVCGCAAGAARPAVGMALQHSAKPDVLATVFAGQDKDATERARSYLVGYPPSSPSMALLKDGEVVHMVHRHDIEGYTAEQIADKLKQLFDTYCG